MTYQNSELSYKNDIALSKLFRTSAIKLSSSNSYIIFFKKILHLKTEFCDELNKTIVCMLELKETTIFLPFCQDIIHVPKCKGKLLAPNSVTVISLGEDLKCLN